MSATLLVKNRNSDSEVTRSIAQLVVYNVSTAQQAEPIHLAGSASILVARQFGTGGLRAIGAAAKVKDFIEPATLFVAKADAVLNIRYKRSTIVVQSIQKSEAFVKPVDQNQIVKEIGEEETMTSVDLDLAVSFDTYFDFNMRSIEGIKTVIDEKNQVVESQHDSYGLHDLVPGKAIRRTVLTKNDFRLTLNIRPTIVKSAT